MSRKINLEKISDNSANIITHSTTSKNTDITQKGLISQENSKKINEKKSSSSKKVSEKLSKKLRKGEESIYNLENLENDAEYSSRDLKKKLEKKKTDKGPQKIIIDDIENIYISLIGKSSAKLLFQTALLLIISFSVNLCHWIYLFLFKQKLENNYCLTKLNQFDNCLPSDICNEYEQKINLFLYNDTLDIHKSGYNEHQNFIKEQEIINYYYKRYFVSLNYNISKYKLITNIDMTKHKIEKINFVVILTKHEKYDMFLKYYNICLKERINLYPIVIIFLGGFLGSFFFGLIADIYGRKKIINLLLFLIFLAFGFITLLSFELGNKYDYYLDEYNKNYEDLADDRFYKYYDILSKLYSQEKTGAFLEKRFCLYILLLFIICCCLRPLGKICLALLLENSVTDLSVIQNFRIYTFVTTGFPPIIAFCIFVIVNNFIVTMLIMFLLFFLLFLISFFFLHESMRYHYEYSQWKELTYEITYFYKIKDDNTFNFKSKLEYEAFRLEENRKMNSKFIQRINSIFSFVKHRIYSLNRDIRRNSDFIIKNEEVVFNPLIIYSSFAANRAFNKLKWLMIIILIIIYCQVFFVEKELVDITFFDKSDLYIDTENNIIINSNYFILGLLTYVSNFLFYLCYRISCFKHIFYSSLIIVTILMIVYYFVAGDTDDYPLDINQNSFNMFQVFYKNERNKSYNIILFSIYFFLNGINLCINILAIKLTNTLYRCSMFGINSILSLLSFAFGQAINYQIEHYFLLIGGLNLLGIIAEFFFGELKGIPNIINDLKQNVNKDNDKNKEKIKKL